MYNYSTGGNGLAIYTYLWDFGDGTTSALPYPNHVYTTAGPFYLCLTVTTGSSGAIVCTSNYCDSIHPGIPRSQNTTLNVIDPATVGVQEHKDVTEQLDNYPIPFTHNTTITYAIKQNSSIELSVVDLLGNKVVVIENGNKSAGTYKTNLDASNISAGIYLLQLKADNKITTKKLVITQQ